MYDLFYSIFLLLQRIKYTVTDVQTRCFFLGFQLLHIKIGIITYNLVSGFNIYNELLGDFLWIYQKICWDFNFNPCKKYQQESIDVQNIL